MDKNIQQQLIQAAIDMRQRSKSPYSNYSVGAALLCSDDSIIGGCNVESASYGLTCCAERVAIYQAIARGHGEFKALAVATSDGGSPCGACRQVIWDQCGDIPVFVSDENGHITEYTSAELLPAAFGGENLR